MNCNILRIIICIYFIIFVIPVIYGVRGSCHTCLYKQYRFPMKNRCNVYDTLCDIALKNCTKYELSFKSLLSEL